MKHKADEKEYDYLHLVASSKDFLYSKKIVNNSCFMFLQDALF